MSDSEVANLRLKRTVDSIDDSVHKLARTESKLLDLQAFTQGIVSDFSTRDFPVTCSYSDPLLNCEFQALHSANKQLKKVILLVNSDTAATLKDLRKENEALRKQTESLSVQVLTHQLLSKDSIIKNLKSEIDQLRIWANDLQTQNAAISAQLFLSQGKLHSPSVEADSTAESKDISEFV